MKFAYLTLFVLFAAACSNKVDQESLKEENNRAIIEFAKVIGASEKVLSDDWGIAAKSKLKHQNSDFAFISRKVEADELTKILKKIEGFYQKQPFILWIEDINKDLVPLLEKAGYKQALSFPGLHLRLNREFGSLTPADISIKKVNSEDTLKDWAYITSTVQQLPYETLLQFIKDTLQKAPHVSFYVAYYQNKPVSSRMMIVFNKTVTGYLSSTLPDHRGRGVASYLLSYALNELKKDGIQLFVIQALPGPIVWKKFGLKENGNNFLGFTKIAD